jgi:hypothetical protein
VLKGIAKSHSDGTPEVVEVQVANDVVRISVARALEANIRTAPAKTLMTVVLIRIKILQDGLFSRG